MTIRFTALPAQYAKFITSLAGLAVVYIQQYGLVWQTVPALTGIGAALAVLGVPNAPKPSAAPAPAPPSQATGAATP